MNVVDSSGWLEYFADGPNARFFAPHIEAIHNLLVPTICIAEVFKRVLTQRGEDSAIQAIALMRQGAIVDIDFAIALSAAKIGHELKLPLADSLILACARAHNAMLYTQDSDFDGIEGVDLIRKR